MTDITDEHLLGFINELDDLILKWGHGVENHNISGILLSRVTLLMSDDTDVGKKLLMFVWNKLDELEQSNPSQYL